MQRNLVGIGISGQNRRRHLVRDRCCDPGSAYKWVQEETGVAGSRIARVASATGVRQDQEHRALGKEDGTSQSEKCYYSSLSAHGEPYERWQIRLHCPVQIDRKAVLAALSFEVRVSIL